MGGVTINNNVIYDNVEIKENFRIGNNNVIGYNWKYEHVMNLDKNIYDYSVSKVIIFNNCRISNFVVIYDGTELKDNVYVDDYVRIGRNCCIGENTHLLYGAKLYDNVIVGHDCKIAGFIPHNTQIGDNVTMMGNLVHKYDNPDDWGTIELSPTICDYAVVGYNAMVIGGIRIGKNSYIASNATVTKNVPENSVVIGINQVYSKEKWKARF